MMFSLFVFWLVYTVGFGQGQQCLQNGQCPYDNYPDKDCGIDVKLPNTRVTGTDTDKIDSKKHPYIVSLQTLKCGNHASGTGCYKHFCGGTMIAPNLILTAAHCFDDYKSQNPRYKNGQQYFPPNQAIYAAISPPCSQLGNDRFLVDSIFFHPQYQAILPGLNKVPLNDIAILEILGSQGQFYQGPLVEVVGEETTEDVDEALVLGYGQVQPQHAGKYIVQPLHGAKLELVTQQFCLEFLDKFDNLSSSQLNYTNMMCYWNWNADACNGDSGGPLLSNQGIQIGLVSWGPGSDCSNVDAQQAPGVYTRLTLFANWIQQMLKELSVQGTIFIPPPPAPTPTLSPTPFRGSVSVPPTNLFVSSLRTSINPLGLNLYDKLCAGVDNCVFSPYSLYVLISMLAQGARETTFTELVSLMSFEESQFDVFSRALQQVIATIDKEIEGFQLSSANSLYTNQDDYKVKDSYITALQNIYQGQWQQLNFKGNPEGARVEINQDVSDATNGLIQDLLPQGTINELTEMVLTNAIYFKANWLLPFDKEKTVTSDFKISPEQTVQVPMMYVDGNFRFKFLNLATIVELPYDSQFPSSDNSPREDTNDVSMVLLLPTENFSVEDLDLNFFIEESQKMISTSTQEFETPLEVYLPKFEIEFDAGSMKQVFTTLGLKSAFDPKLADFRSITDEKGLFVSDIFHKAKILINEEGTEAAARAAAFLNFGSLILSQEIRFDRPFGFMMIYKPSASILFMGKVGDPRVPTK